MVNKILISTLECKHIEGLYRYIVSNSTTTITLAITVISCRICHFYYFICIEYSDSSHTWKLVGVANDSQLGSKERIDEKIEKIRQFARDAKQQPADDGAEVQGLSDVVHRELLQQVEELQQEVQNFRERAERAEVRIKWRQYTK